MRLALLHDFLLYWGGAERILQGLTTIFPNAPLYTLFYDKNFTKDWFPKTTIYHSSLQPLWRVHRLLLPLLPSKVESFNFDTYDVVISSGAFSKGIIVKPYSLHIHYCHTPTRFLWEERRQYIKTSVPFGLRSLVSGFLNPLRLWDYQAAQRPDVIITNSEWTRRKIAKIYHRDAQVVYPFVSVDRKTTLPARIALQKHGRMKNYFLIVSRLQRYKQIDLAIEVFNQMKLPLVIAGAGTDQARLKRMAGPTVRLLGFVSEDALSGLYSDARAVILPGIEDFGIVPIEAMAQGTPVIAYGQGGAKETVLPGKTGEVFFELTSASLRQGVDLFLRHELQYQKNYIRQYAKRFSFKTFEHAITRILQDAHI